MSTAPNSCLPASVTQTTTHRALNSIAFSHWRPLSAATSSLVSTVAPNSTIKQASMYWFFYLLYPCLCRFHKLTALLLCLRRRFMKEGTLRPNRLWWWQAVCLAIFQVHLTLPPFSLNRRRQLVQPNGYLQSLKVYTTLERDTFIKIDWFPWLKRFMHVRAECQNIHSNADKCRLSVQLPIERPIQLHLHNDGESGKNH